MWCITTLALKELSEQFWPVFYGSLQDPVGGRPLNFDGPHSDEVRRFFIENALYWITTCHIDASRLDAVHAIVDCSAYPFLAEFTDVVHEQAGSVCSGRSI